MVTPQEEGVNVEWKKEMVDKAEPKVPLIICLTPSTCYCPDRRKRSREPFDVVGLHVPWLRSYAPCRKEYAAVGIFFFSNSGIGNETVCELSTQRAKPAFELLRYALMPALTSSTL